VPQIFKYNILKIIGILLVISTYILQAQDTPIQAIKFQGLEKTQKNYLERFIKTKIGTSLDSTQLETDARQLRNLNAFSDVDFQVEVNPQQGTIITFICNEVKTLLPIFNFGIVPGNEWVKVGAMDVNSFGKGIELSAFYQYNQRHSFLFQTRMPNIRGGAFGISGNILRWSSIEPLYFGDQTVWYNYNNNSVQLNGLYDLTLNQTIEVGGSIFRETYRKDNQVDESLQGPNEVSLTKWLGRFNHSIRKMDYFFFYRSGYHNNISYQTVGTIGEPNLFHIVSNDFRYYKRINAKTNLALRNIIGISTNNNSPFSAFVIDSHTNLRGSGNRIARSTGLITLNLEYRYSLFENDEVAIQGTAFSDIGYWRESGQKWIDDTPQDNQLIFLGGGLRFIHKRIYNAIFRIDYGINTKDPKHGGIVLGLGQYF